jgi:feruloyl esterase
MMSVNRLAAVFAISTFAAITGWAQPSCEKLAAAHFPGISITSATLISAGPFVAPAGGPRIPTFVAPAFCRVAAIVEAEVAFELWMPERWNTKLLAVGNGGLAGTISYSAMIKPLQEGYATSSTDTGHVAGGTDNGSWALNRYDRIINFADRATHLMAEADKVILAAFYSAAPSHSYFSGCSQGGHEAFIEAQRYPNDYDGIIAGDPANYWTHHYVGGHLWPAIATDGDAYIPAEKVSVIADAVNEACDALDGVKDGVLSDPRRCHFDPAKLLCTGSDTSKCLTSPQVSAVQKIWAGLKTADGRQIWPGLVPGGEAGTGGWANWITGTGPGRSGHLNLGIPFFRYMLFDNPAWDYHSFRLEPSDGFDSDIDYLDSKLGAIFNAINPDLSAFKARGGKLIQYHGWSDPDITPLNSINYYESVQKTMGSNTAQFYRLYMVPGMQHCNGGPGATTFDMVGPLDTWVTSGAAPDSILASKLTNGAVTRTRPLCPYPQEATWKGTGSTDDAASFSCTVANPPVK